MTATSQQHLEALAQRLGTQLKARGEVLATAESCTGGWVGQTITAMAGSSSWFERGFITYSNLAKKEMLGVSENTLTRHGAVSEITAGEMALGALQKSHADWSLSITGIAGPDGGSPEKPVGTVCFGWAQKDGSLVVTTKHFSGNREEIRRQAVATALQGLLDQLAPCVA